MLLFIKLLMFIKSKINYLIFIQLIIRELYPKYIFLFALYKTRLRFMHSDILAVQAFLLIVRFNKYYGFSPDYINLCNDTS